MQIDLDGKIILFYDGDCGFCNSSVQFVLKHRRKTQKIYFVTLQSDFAKKTLHTYQIDIKLDTLYVLKNKKVYQKSAAAIELTKLLKMPYLLLVSMIIVPKVLRDWGYTKIANKRHQIMKSFCVLPKEDERVFFLIDK